MYQKCPCYVSKNWNVYFAVLLVFLLGFWLSFSKKLQVIIRHIETLKVLEVIIKNHNPGATTYESQGRKKAHGYEAMDFAQIIGSPQQNPITSYSWVIPPSLGFACKITYLRIMTFLQQLFNLSKFQNCGNLRNATTKSRKWKKMPERTAK